MEIIKTQLILNLAVSRCRSNGESVGFVPTMGAIHQGHLSLIERCRKENKVVIVSIFVNPTQFDDKKDLENYPESFEEDVQKLEDSGVDFLFYPSVNEMYPEADNSVFDFGNLDKLMEGTARPGHFKGVAQIVCKLFDVVMPDRAYFGEKDFQQLAIVKHLVATKNYNIDIVACPIIREDNGLAMSSRNALLTAKQRVEAAVIFKALSACAEKVKNTPINELKDWAIAQIDGTANMKTEYFEIVDRKTLQSASEYGENCLQACIAVRVSEGIRLIDNISL